jgi:hypothetical protein
MWVAIHKGMEPVVGNSLYSCLYSKLAKTVCLSYYLLYFAFDKIGEEGETGSAQKGTGEVVQTMYTHVIKCKNEQIKGKNKIRLSLIACPVFLYSLHTVLVLFHYFFSF